MIDDCERCELLLQPYLDRELDESERAEAEAHLDLCSYCRRRYVFEEKLRMYVRQSVVEPMPPELKERLAALRIAL
ncbi:MAG TPA: zf-HC2 domain-containing protein [Gaiellaceae bacterium]|nr:zf-HC2 domain-containing protein [Gaiellaceae bacterium]